jgi:hypothetical protein
VESRQPEEAQPAPVQQGQTSLHTFRPEPVRSRSAVATAPEPPGCDVLLASRRSNMASGPGCSKRSHSTSTGPTPSVCLGSRAGAVLHGRGIVEMAVQALQESTCRSPLASVIFHYHEPGLSASSSRWWSQTARKLMEALARELALPRPAWMILLI